MITYLAQSGHTYTIERYLETRGQAVAGRFRVESYQDFLQDFLQDANFKVRPGAYIFSDIERMTPGVARIAAQAWAKISELGGEARLLNHPTRSMRRYELLRTLYEHGDNTFNAYRLVECRRPQCWPVFIRDEHEHTKNLTPLLHFPEQLDARVAEILARGDSREDKMVVEFCDTQDDQGLFYKYGASLIGKRLIARHIWASRHWMIAQSRYSMKTPEVLENERRYVETNPHESELRAIFRRARIDYGRIDYSMLGNRLQVWEINTNPTIFGDTGEVNPKRAAMLSQIAERIGAAFAEIDVQDDSDPPDPSGESQLGLLTDHKDVRKAKLTA